MANLSALALIAKDLAFTLCHKRLLVLEGLGKDFSPAPTSWASTVGCPNGIGVKPLGPACSDNFYSYHEAF